MVFSNKQSEPKSVLVLGATGKTGIECIRELSGHSSKPQIHAFCRDPSKLNNNDKALCASIVEGNARKEADIERALSKSKADVVVVSLGNGESVKKNDIRTTSGQALAAVMKKPDFKHVQALIVSSTGAGSSRIIVGFGIGKLISFHLRHVLNDHSGQEMAFAPAELKKKTTIVRATALTDNKATGKLVTFGDLDKSPSIETNRVDLAKWITNEICNSGNIFGKVVNVTGVKM